VNLECIFTAFSGVARSTGTTERTGPITTPCRSQTPPSSATHSLDVSLFHPAGQVNRSAKRFTINDFPSERFLKKGGLTVHCAVQQQSVRIVSASKSDREASLAVRTQ